MPTYDVVVAGGGPAGLQFAREVGRRSEYSVAVLERHASLADNDKSTGGTFDQVVDGFDLPDRVVMSTNPGMIFEGPTAKGHVELRNYVLDFPAFLTFLGEDARQHGVDIITDTTVQEPIVEDGHVQGVRARHSGTSTTFRGDLIVDATGPDGVLTTALGMWDRAAAQRGIGKEFEVTGTFDRDAMLFRFDHTYAPGGYTWVFPAGEQRFKIGVCWVNDFHDRHAPADGGGIDDYLDTWIASDPRWTVDEVAAVHAGAVVSDNSINQRAGNGILAIGDAVSSINPLFGEGIRPAMQSASMAATVALQALNQGDTSREALAAYEREWNARMGPRWKLQRMVGELLYDFDAEQQDVFIEKLKDLSPAQIDRLQTYRLTPRELLSLYPFKPKDVPKFPTVLRHLQ